MSEKPDHEAVLRWARRLKDSHANTEERKGALAYLAVLARVERAEIELDAALQGKEACLEHYGEMERERNEAQANLATLHSMYDDLRARVEGLCIWSSKATTTAIPAIAQGYDEARAYVADILHPYAGRHHE